MEYNDDKKIFAIKQQSFSKIVKNDDGSTTFKGAILFAEGVWTNSMGETRKFTTEELQKTIAMWDGQDIWHKHGEFSGHAPGDHIGEYINPRMINGAVTTDLIAHGRTQASKDAISMWKAGKKKDLSPELTYEDREKDGEVTEGINIIPYAVAWVTKGACTVCKVNAGGQEVVNEKEFSAVKAELEEAKIKLAELSDCKEATAKNFSEMETKTKEFMGTKETELKELKEQMKSFAEDIKKIKDSPVIKGIYEKEDPDKIELVEQFKKTSSGDFELKAFE